MERKLFFEKPLEEKKLHITSSLLCGGVIVAIAPQKRQCEFGRLYPAGSSVEVATTKPETLF